MNNLEIFEFFKNCPKHLRVNCIEEVLIFGIRKIKEKFKRNLDPTELLKLNKKLEKTWTIDFTPNFKAPKSQLAKELPKTKLGSSRGLKENICPDTTCLPLKKMENRKTKSANFCSTQASEKELTWKKSNLGESMEKENQVIQMADEFLKNPFSKVLVINKPLLANMLIDSNLYSTIEINSPTATWASDI